MSVSPNERSFWGTNYDPVKRRQEIDKRVKDALEKIRFDEIPQKALNPPSQNTSSWREWLFKSKDKPEPKKEPRGIITMRLTEIENEVECLSQDAEKFPSNSCVTKEYVVMKGRCSKLTTDLYKIEECITGREKLLQRKEKVMQDINQIEKILDSKLHNGECKTGTCTKPRN